MTKHSVRIFGVFKFPFLATEQHLHNCLNSEKFNIGYLNTV